MGMKDRIIECIKKSELKAEDYYAMYGKKNIEAEIEKLRKSDEKILSTYSVDKMRIAVETKLNKKSAFQILKLPTVKYIKYAMTAAIIAAFSVPLAINLVKSKSIENVPSIRTKGLSVGKTYPLLTLYRQKGSEINVLENGNFAKQGDTIQITYKAGDDNYGLIFSVDGNGDITRHFPEGSWNAGKLKHGDQEIPLDFSYTLDNAPDFECFIFVTSKTRFNFDNIEKKLKNKRDIEYLSELSYLPKKTEGTTFILEK